MVLGLRGPHGSGRTFQPFYRKRELLLLRPQRPHTVESIHRSAWKDRTWEMEWAWGPTRIRAGRGGEAVGAGRLRHLPCGGYENLQEIKLRGRVLQVPHGGR